DNGMFTLILGNIEKEIVRLPIQLICDRNEILKRMLQVIKDLMDGKFKELGTADTQIAESYFASPTVDAQTIRATIIFIDSFGNAVVNVNKELFEKEQKGRGFIIHLRKS